ncbi:protein takeout [Leptinotarsa decemlineata]|uniref:protein takeout n=1 Tax=Leptinotarsa decemlineata TaxID=7539 RepID=UPI003D308DB2
MCSAMTLLLLLFLFALGLVVPSVNSKQLPPYITPCRKSDPNLNECAKQRGNDAIPFLIRGDKAYKIPSFDPAHISLVDVDQGELKFKLKDMHMTGLNTTQILDAKLDFKNKHFYFKVFIDETKVVSRYEVSGKVASIAIEGEGPAEIISTNITVEYFFDYDLITKKDGKQYFNLDTLKSNLTAHVEKTHYNFGNLFGGNKLLGDNFNKFLNENTHELEDSAGKSNREIINAIVSSVFQGIFKNVSFDEMFLD